MDFIDILYEGKPEIMKKQEINSEEKNAPMPRFHLEIDGGRRGAAVRINGVRHIEEYTAERLVLQIPGGRMRLFGAGMSLSVFENRSIEVRGKLSEVGFSYDRN